MSANALVALPDTIGGLKKLEVLKVGRSQLAALPPSLAECKQLEHLTLDGNPLETVQVSIY